MRPDYRPHASFIDPARAHAQIWRLVAGLILAGVAYVMLSQLYFTALTAGIGPLYGDWFTFDLQTGATPVAMLALLFNFGLMTLALAGVVMILHDRNPITLLGPFAQFRSQFRAAVAALVALSVVLFILPPWGMDEPLVPGLKASVWFSLLPLSLLAVLVQTSAEEILFRGYMQQQLAARFASPLIWMGLPSAIFAAGHYLPDLAGENAIYIALWAGLFGCLMADLTARSGTLGPAIAVHFINNVLAILVTSVPDDLFGLALYTTPFSLADTEAMAAWLPVDFGLMLVSWLAVRLALRR